MNELGLDASASSTDVKSISASVNDSSADEAHMNELGLDENVASADVNPNSADVKAQSSDDAHQNSNRWSYFLDHRKSFS